MTPAGGLRPPVGLILAIGIACVSSSAILIRWCASGPEAVAFWRLALASVVLLLIGARTEDGRRRLRRALGSPWAIGAGLFLAVHFWLWIWSLDETSVAASTFLLAVQVPVAGLLSWLWLHEPPGRRGLAGMVIGMTGIGLLWGLDRLAHGAGSSVARGDLLAIGAGVAYVGYVGVGRRVRERVPLLLYLAGVYSWAAVAVAAGAVLGGLPLMPAETSDWGLLGLLALIPTLGGHGLLNLSLARVRVYVVNLAVMGEPVVASLLAWGLLSEPPPGSAWIAAPLILAGAVLALGERTSPRRARRRTPVLDRDDED